MRPWLRYFLWLALGALAFASGRWLSVHPRALTAPSGIAAVDALTSTADRFTLGRSALWVVDAGPGGLFRHAPLSELAATTKALSRQRICRTVIALTELEDAISTAEGTEVVGLVPSVPSSDEELQLLRTRILSRSDLVDQIIASDAQKTLVICPLVNPDAPFTWSPGELRHTRWTRVDAIATAGFIAADLQLSAALMVLLALPLMLVMLMYERRYQRRFAVWGALVVGMLTLTASVVTWRSLLMARDGFSTVLGGRAFDAARALDAVTKASTSAVVTVDGDFATSAGLAKLDATCAALHKLGGVSCPTDALRRAASALTGESVLPKTDEQARQLWFLIGDRPELALLFTPDRGHALVRLYGRHVTLPPDLPLPSSLASLYAASRALRSFLIIGLIVAVLGCLLSVWLGRRLGWGSLPLAAAAAVAAFACPLALLTLVLLTLAAWTVFASLASTSITMKDLE